MHRSLGVASAPTRTPASVSGWGTDAVVQDGDAGLAVDHGVDLPYQFSLASPGAREDRVPTLAGIGGGSMRQRVSSASPFEPQIGFSRAVRVADRVLVSGTGPVWPNGECPADPAVQTRRCLEIIEAALGEAGASMTDVVRTRMFLTSAADANAVAAVHGEVFGDVRPAATMIVIAALLDPRWKIEVEAEAVVS